MGPSQTLPPPIPATNISTLKTIQLVSAVKKGTDIHAFLVMTLLRIRLVALNLVLWVPVKHNGHQALELLPKPVFQNNFSSSEIGELHL